MSDNHSADDLDLGTIEMTFPLGRIVATPRAKQVLVLSSVQPADLIARHARRDWGDISDSDRVANDAAVDRDESLLSAYNIRDGFRIWVVTEHDRSVTTILLPDEY